MITATGRLAAPLRQPLRGVRRLSKIAGSSFFRGVWPIMATPFKPDESLDVKGFQKSIAFMARAGAAGVTINGVLGESNRLTDREREVLISAAVATAASAGRPFRVCVGTSHAGTTATVALSQMAQELGADAVMVTPSKEAAPVADSLIAALYSRVATGCPGLPIVLQDHPGSTQVHMSVPLLSRIVEEVPAVACIKLESLPTPARIAALHATPQFAQSECTILTGLGALYAGFDVEQRTHGFMTGFAFPEILIAIHEAAEREQFESAHAIYTRFLPLIVFEQQPGVGVRKEIYRLRGLIDSGHVRHPGSGISPTLKVALEAQLQRSLPGVHLTQPLPPQLLEL